MDTAVELELEEDMALTETVREISEYELERGKPMPNEQHSRTQLNISAALKAKYKKTLTVLPELSIVLGSRTAVPDICVYPRYDINWQQEPPAAKAEPPLLAIEIVSPSQTLAEIREKTREYFAHGIQSCWIVQPELQTVSVLHPDEKARTYDSGTVEDGVVGILITVEEVFE